MDMGDEPITAELSDGHHVYAGGNPVYVHPGYTFSGANMGGQSLQVCLGCFALVQDQFTSGHTVWHGLIGH